MKHLGNNPRPSCLPERTGRLALAPALVLMALVASHAWPRRAAGRGGPGAGDLRDTWFSNVGPEADGNLGGSPKLKLKSYQEFSLIDIDPQPLKGRVVREALLHLRLTGEPRLHRVTVGSIGADWVEGTASGYGPTGGKFDAQPPPSSRRPLELSRKRPLQRDPGTGGDPLAHGRCARAPMRGAGSRSP